MKKLTAILLSLAMLISLFSFAAAEGAGDPQTFEIGICNFVDDAGRVLWDFRG